MDEHGPPLRRRDCLDSFIGELEQSRGCHPSQSTFLGEVIDRDRSRPKRQMRSWSESEAVDLGDHGTSRSERPGRALGRPPTHARDDRLQSYRHSGVTTVEIGGEQAGSRQAVILGDGERRCVGGELVGSDPPTRSPEHHRR